MKFRLGKFRLMASGLGLMALLTVISVNAAITPTQQARLTVIDGGDGNRFGDSVSVAGDTAVVGAFRDDDKAFNSGAAYVFTRNGTTWSEQAKLTASDATAADNFGISVSVSGDTAVVGAFRDDDHGFQSGSAYVFTRTGTTWSEQAKLTASDATAAAHFGWFVSVSGDTAVVGAPIHDGSENKGAAYVFTRNGTTWSEQAKLTASDGEAFDTFGFSVSVAGDTVVLGAHNNKVGRGKGSVYVFTRSGTTWSEQAKLTGSDEYAENDFGRSVSVAEDTVVLGTGSASAYVYVLVPPNQPPTANAGGPYSGDEGSAISLNGSSSDDDGDSLTVTWNVSSPLCTFSNSSILDPDITCSDNGIFTATLTADDGISAPVTSDAHVIVDNVAPVIVTGDLSCSLAVVAVNTDVDCIAIFNDVGTDDTHEGLWDWDDNSSSSCPPNDAECSVIQDPGFGSVDGTHSYNDPGVYTVTLTVTDDDGGFDSETFEFVVVYDPNGGFVTGGGWIDSPEEACPVFCNDATGKANFGFVSKYKNGATVPTGQTEFNFKAGDLNFHSTSYDWLVIAGKKAMYKGDGTVNGDAGFTFQINAIDGDLSGGDGIDKFRIKIKQTVGGVIYDNQSGAGDNDDPTTELSGGSIKIHKGN